MINRKIILGAALSAMILPASAFASEPGFYLGGKIGSSSTNREFIDDSDNSFGVYAGYRVNPYFAVEGEYSDFGDFDVSFRQLEFDNPRLGPRTWGLRAIGFVPINQNFELFGSVGYHSFDLNPRDDQGFREVVGTSDSSDWFYGVGGQFNFANNLSLRTQYQRYEFKSAGRTDEISLGLHYRF